MIHIKVSGQVTVPTVIPRASYSLPLIYFVTILVLLLFHPILEVHNNASSRIYETVKINIFVVFRVSVCMFISTLHLKKVFIFKAPLGKWIIIIIIIIINKNVV